MEGFASWVEGNWFFLIQTLGIIGGLLHAAAAANRDAKAREEQNLLTLAVEHRKLWEAAALEPELARISREDVNPSAEPPTHAETEYLNEKIRHFLTGWRLAKRGGRITPEELAMDVRGFFSLPLPLAVWEKTKRFRNQRFVRFVEESIR